MTKNIFKNNNWLLPVLLGMIFCMISCKKFLEEKPVQNIAVPSKLADLQALIDNQIINDATPDNIELISDNLYMTSSGLTLTGPQNKQNYTWQDNGETNNRNFAEVYNAVYVMNFILDYLPKITYSPTEQQQFNSIKGTALFGRAFIFHQTAQVYCRPYSSTSATDPGIILRLTAAIEAPSVRATVEDTYLKIIADTKEAVDLLPVTTNFTTRPNKAAAYGLLARVYLSMRNYEEALRYAELALDQNNILMDYNTLMPAAAMPGFRLNPEISFRSSLFNTAIDPGRHNVDSVLYNSYDADDLRKELYYKTNAGNTYWFGSYHPEGLQNTVFTGIANDEMYFIKAECLARKNDRTTAMDVLNTLLRKRWKTGLFLDFDAATSQEALEIILTERRKGLAFRGLRWSDLRRFNVDGANISLKRVIGNEIFTLPANDLRWVYLIPTQEIVHSGVPQNPR